MKKLIISLLFCLFLSPLAAFSNNNFIYSINVTRDENLSDNVKLEIKSDYKTDIKNKIDEMGREYFDIKDASLKENFAVQYNNANGVESVIAQQIGNKVRIYVTGNDIQDVTLNFNNVENQPYPDKSAGYALLVFAFVICALFRVFKKKAKRLKVKTQIIQNAASKAVYNDLMEKRTNSNKIYDNRNLTLNTLNKRNGNIVRPAVSGRMNPNTVEAYQGMRQLQSRVAM